MADVAAAEEKLREAFERAKQHMDAAKREAWAKARLEPIWIALEGRLGIGAGSGPDRL
jgi:hypothetical protein